MIVWIYLRYIPIYARYILIFPIYPDISSIFYQKIKLMLVCATNPIFPRYIGPKPIHRRYFIDIIDFFSIFRLIDYRWPISFRPLSISDIRYIGDIWTDILNILNLAYEPLHHLPNRGKNLMSCLKD